MRCPECNKFPAISLDTEPDVDLNIDDVSVEGDKATAQVSGTVHIVLTSECCNAELKESTFDVCDLNVEVQRNKVCTCDLADLNIDASPGEITDRSQTTMKCTIKRGPDKGKVVEKPIKPRYQKRYYGCSVEITVSCGCGKSQGHATFWDECQSSGMDEMT